MFNPQHFFLFTSRRVWVEENVKESMAATESRQANSKWRRLNVSPEVGLMADDPAGCTGRLV